MADTPKVKKKPTLTAYVVVKGKEGKKSFWHEVGAVWMHEDGDGMDVVIHQGISVNGKITCRVRKEKDAASDTN